MRTSDFLFAAKLANTMDWNMAREDFEFMASLEPEGCFVVFQGSERLGIATSISFGKVGWFGNLIVKENARNKGAGSLLVRHAVNYLQSKGVKTIGLYAYPNLISFYGNLGFERDEDFSVMHADALGSLTAETLPKTGIRQIQPVATFDSDCLGGNRKKLLASIILEKGNLSFCLAESDVVVGYVAAKVYEKMAELGPLMVRGGHFDDAVMLIKAALARLTGLSVYAALPKKETSLMNMLFSVGFEEDFCVSRMFLGRALSKTCICMAESLERG
ncbi:MAG TPA: GNAT family N-acetyltransferase [Verrucomicrobiae bacterium]|nr:GNAT family N-acetyltransferase [Verrucomicrobiae bacterium]